jgi:hypothetical protein
MNFNQPANSNPKNISNHEEHEGHEVKHLPISRALVLYPTDRSF